MPVEEFYRLFWSLAEMTVRSDTTIEMLQSMPIYNWKLFHGFDPKIKQFLQSRQQGLSQDVMTDAPKLLELAKSAEATSKWQGQYLHSQHEQTKQDKDASTPRIYCTNCGKNHMGGAKSCHNPRPQDDKKRKLEFSTRDRKDRRDQRNPRDQRDFRDQRPQRRDQRDSRDQRPQRDQRDQRDQANADRRLKLRKIRRQAKDEPSSEGSESDIPDLEEDDYRDSRDDSRDSRDDNRDSRDGNDCGPYRPRLNVQLRGNRR